MSLQELKEQAFKLSVSDRLSLVSAIMHSLQETSSVGVSSAKGDRPALIQQMRGFLKTDQPAPTDAQVETMLEERRVEKYLA